MNDETLTSLRNVLDYTQKLEEDNFWMNCQCPEEQTNDRNTIKQCTCQENKHHIHRDVVKVLTWIDGDY